MTPHRRHAGFSPRRLFSVARKELLHILRDPTTLFFSLFIPILEMLMLGYAINTNVRDIPTVANGLGVAILSTPKGVMSDTRAREEKVGGEVLCNIF